MKSKNHGNRHRQLYDVMTSYDDFVITSSFFDLSAFCDQCEIHIHAGFVSTECVSTFANKEWMEGNELWRTFYKENHLWNAKICREEVRKRVLPIFLIFIIFPLRIRNSTSRDLYTPKSNGVEVSTKVRRKKEKRKKGKKYWYITGLLVEWTKAGGQEWEK